MFFRWLFILFNWLFLGRVVLSTSFNWLLPHFNKLVFSDCVTVGEFQLIVFVFQLIDFYYALQNQTFHCFSKELSFYTLLLSIFCKNFGKFNSPPLEFNLNYFSKGLIWEGDQWDFGGMYRKWRGPHGSLNHWSRCRDREYMRSVGSIKSNRGPLAQMRERVREEKVGVWERDWPNGPNER